jgi:excisionase family DNA binding protein
VAAGGEILSLWQQTGRGLTNCHAFALSGSGAIMAGDPAPSGEAMSRTAKKPKPAKPAPLGDVLTLPQAAVYLQLSEEEVLRAVNEMGLAAQQIGAEWRFSKAAIQAWLSQPRASKAAQRAVAGAWKDDPFVEEELREIYQRRRSMTEDEK